MGPMHIPELTVRLQNSQLTWIHTNNGTIPSLSDNIHLGLPTIKDKNLKVYNDV